MSARFHRSALVLLMCGAIVTAPIAADAQAASPQPKGSASERLERIQREAATFAQGEPVEISTFDGRLLIGAFEDVSPDWVMVSVPTRGSWRLEQVPMLIIRTITPPRPHPEISLRREIKRVVWGTVTTYGFIFAGLLLLGAHSH